MVTNGRIMRPAGVMIVLLGVAGYASNIAGRKACRDVVARELHEILGHSGFVVNAKDSDSDGVEMFDGIGRGSASVDDGRGQQFPAVSLRSSGWLPFLIVVDYRWEREEEIGESGRIWFATAFGWHIRLGTTDRKSL